MSADDIEVGDTVRIGKGKVLWAVESFGRFNRDVPYAVLRPLDGYGTSSATLDRLTVVTKAGAA